MSFEFSEIDLRNPIPAATQAMLAAARLTQLGINFPVIAAPMVGLSHVAFRELVRHYMPQGLDVLCFTEMLSSRRVPSEKLTSSRELRAAENESHFIPQLLCNEERFIEPSLRKLEQQNPWGFDINMGCPVSHVLKHNWGVRLMGDPQYAAQVVKTARRHTQSRLSVKMRGSATDTIDEEYLYRFCSTLVEAGVDWLTVHARPKSKRHSGRANWDIVARLQEKIPIPIVTNGDIQTADDALTLLCDYKAAGIMPARTLTARPWLFWQLAEQLGIEQAPANFTGQKAPRGEDEGTAYLEACLYFIDRLQYHYGDCEYAVERFRFFVATGSPWFTFGHSFWAKSMKQKSLATMREMVTHHMTISKHPMVGRIDL